MRTLFGFFKKKTTSEMERRPDSVPVNYQKQQAHIEKLNSDVDYALSVAKSYYTRFPDGLSGLRNKVIWEIGPGINFGTSMLFACCKAKVVVSDAYLAPWDNDYHPHFYSLLRDEIVKQFPDTDVKMLDRILKKGNYLEKYIRCIEKPLEEMHEVKDESIDITLSNAVFEHLVDPERAIQHLWRITKKNGFGYHQVDFRDHRDFNKPLDFLLMNDDDFTRLYQQTFGECGNRLRPFEYEKILTDVGFNVTFTPTFFADDEYMTGFLERYCIASGEKKESLNYQKYSKLGGFYHLRK